MNFFSSDPYLTVLADVHHPRRKCSVEIVKVDTQHFRLLVLDEHEVVERCPFLDFFEPLAAPDVSRREHGFLPRAAHYQMTAEGWQTQPRDERHLPSPFIDWQSVPGWDGFLAHVRQRSEHAFRTTERKRRRIARELGPVNIVMHTEELEVLHQAMRWKSAQYQRSGFWNVFAVPANVAMFVELLRRRLLTVSALYGGGRLLAVHVGAVWNNRFYYWLPAHDPEAAAYSPGTVLTEHLIAESFRAGWTFDFLLGDEPYKWNYATHTRVVGPLGTPPLVSQMQARIGTAARAALRHTPGLTSWARSMKRRWKELGC